MRYFSQKNKLRTSFFVAGLLIILLILYGAGKRIITQIQYKEHIAISSNGVVLPDQILVKFRKSYIPHILDQKRGEMQENEEKISGRLVNILINLDQIVTGANSYTERLDQVRAELLSLGVTKYESAFSIDDQELGGYYILYLTSGSNLQKVQAEVATSQLFEVSEPNVEMSISAVPNDPSFSELWGMRQIQAPQAWDIRTDASSVTVAIIDTGIDSNHPDLAASLVPGTDVVNNDSDPEDDHGHGTHVAGTVGGIGNNGIGVTGVSWNVKLMPVKVMNSQGKGSTLSITRGIKFAADNGAKVLNLSLGGPGFCTQGGTYEATVSNALLRGASVIVAAGNDNQDAINSVPASCPGTITVGATNQDDTRASSFSNYGSVVAIAAPGVEIYSSIPGGGYRKNNGTSMATPHVAGAAALVLAQNPSLSPAGLKECLVSNGDQIVTDRPIGVRLNIFKALQACGESSQVPTATLVPGAPSNTPTPTITPTNIPGVPTNTPTPTRTPTPTVPLLTPTPTIGGFKSRTTPIPTPDAFFTCEVDPACIKSGKSLRLCPLKCAPI